MRNEPHDAKKTKMDVSCICGNNINLYEPFILFILYLTLYQLKNPQKIKLFLGYIILNFFTACCEIVLSKMA